MLLDEQSADLLREFSEVNARARELGLLVHGLGHIQVERNGRLEDIGYTQPIVDALTPASQFPPEVFPQVDMGTRWGTKLRALLDNPDVEITRPKVIVPSDYVRSNLATTPHFNIALPPTYQVKHPVD